MHSNERFVFDDSTFCITAAQNISMLAPYVFDPWTGYVPPDSRYSSRGERESQWRLGAETGGVREDPMGSGGDLTLT